MQLPATPCGIVFTSKEASLVYLPLQQAVVHAEIIDVSAKVTLEQTFWQYSKEGTGRAKYVFPVPSRAAVCGFEMESEDGRIIHAVAKKKETARAEHEAAIKQGQMTGLVEHVTDDIFSISLGALPPLQQITTRLTYAVDLLDADLADQVRFHLPVYIGARYGSLPAGMADAPPLTADRVKISVKVHMKGTIRSLTSPSHPIILSSPDSDYVLPRPQALNDVRHTSRDFLQKDFVLIIKADGLDIPRCFAEHHPTGSIAMQLTLVPRFDLPPVASQEYIFLVDRSGSMAGERIETAKKTLIMLLRALPSQGTTFNVFSFGTTCDSLWPESYVYSQSSMAAATQYVDAMRANYGGTEIRRALESVFASRNRSLPTACFVLTDGEAYDIDATLNSVTTAVAQAATDAPLRAFTLGIGETTSTAMCEGIARVGNGVCLMATTSESIIAKCSKLVKASRTFILKNISINWGAESPLDTTVDLQKDVIRQAPTQVNSLYLGCRFVVFALIKRESFVVPKNILLRAQRDGHGEPVELVIPVEELPVDPKQTLVHTLAARRIIQDLEDEDRPSATTYSAKDAIIHLGEQYQLASRYTSFIAVEKGRSTARPSTEGRAPSPVFEREDQSYGTRSVFGARQARSGGARTAAMSEFRLSSMSRSASSDTQMSLMSQPMLHGRTFGAITSRVPLTGGLAPQPGTLVQTSNVSSARSSVVRPATFAFDTERGGAIGAMPPVPAPQSRDVDHDVVELVRLQSFDGSFAPTAAFQRILGGDALALSAKLRIPPTVWATLLAVAYLQKHLAQQPELLEGLVEKALAFISQVPGLDVADLQQQAQRAIA